VRVGTEGLADTEAYKLTYDCTKLLPEQIKRRSYDLLHSPIVAERIRVLRGAMEAAAVKAAAYTLADAIREAEEIRAKAFTAGNLTAANSAAALKAKLAGHLVEKKEVKFGALEQADVDELEMLRAELRRRLADRHGIDAPSDESNRPVLRAS
jgi:hypothetical protein